MSGELAREADYGTSYWPRNLREPVRFADAIARMADAGCNVFVEVGPHAVLGSSMKQDPRRPRQRRPRCWPRCVAPATRPMEPAGDGGGPIRPRPRGGLGRARHHPARRYVPLPTYPWVRESFWIDEGEASSPTQSPIDRESAPLGRAPASRAEPSVGIREALLSAGSGPARRRLMERRLEEHLARVLRLSASRPDRSRPFKDMGLDSLSALELRDHIEADTDLKLSATIFWNYSTISVTWPPS